jgi:hypothetical protein
MRQHFVCLPQLVLGLHHMSDSTSPLWEVKKEEGSNNHNDTLTSLRKNQSIDQSINMLLCVYRT